MAPEPCKVCSPLLSYRFSGPKDLIFISGTLDYVGLLRYAGRHSQCIECYDTSVTVRPLLPGDPIDPSPFILT